MTRRGFISVPNPAEFAARPFPERRRLYLALKQLLAQWAETEQERPTP